MDFPPPPLTKITQYPPANESAAGLVDERTSLAGSELAMFAYGVHVTLAFMCVSALWNHRKRRPGYTALLLAYVGAHFVCGTLIAAGGALFAEMAWIDNRAYPGGPLMFLAEQQTHWSNAMRIVLTYITAWLQDGLLLYRFFVIYGSRHWLLIIPGGFYLSALVISCVLIAQLYGAPSVGLFTAYWAVEVGATALVTVLIVARLLYMRRRLHALFGNAAHSPYASVAAMVVESSLLFTLVGLAFIATQSLAGSYASSAPLGLCQVQSIAPLLIIWRVARGEAVSRKGMREAEASLSQGATSVFAQGGPRGSRGAASDLEDLESRAPTRTFVASARDSPFAARAKFGWLPSTQGPESIELDSVQRGMKIEVSHYSETT